MVDTTIKLTDALFSNLMAGITKASSTRLHFHSKNGILFFPFLKKFASTRIRFCLKRSIFYKGRAFKY